MKNELHVNWYVFKIGECRVLFSWHCAWNMFCNNIVHVQLHTVYIYPNIFLASTEAQSHTVYNYPNLFLTSTKAELHTVYIYPNLFLTSTKAQLHTVYIYPNFFLTSTNIYHLERYFNDMYEIIIMFII